MITGKLQWTAGSLTDARAWTAVTSSLTAMIVAILYMAARAGFENPVVPVAAIVGLSLWLTVAPLILHLLLRRTESGYSWLASESFLTLAVLACTALAGVVASHAEVSFWPMLAVAGAAGSAWITWRQLKNAPSRATFWFVAATLLLAVWIAGIVWANGFLSPLIVENLILHGGTSHVDTWYLGSLANMLQVHGHASVGLDGAAPLTYHYGSSWLFAQLAALAEVPVMDFYQIGFPVVVVPLFIRGIFICANDVQAVHTQGRVRSLHNSPLLWVLLGAATIGALPPNALHSVAVWASGPILSESYTLVIPLCLLAIGTAAAFRGNAGKGVTTRDGAAEAALFYLVFTPAIIGAIGIVKVSQMLLLLAVMTWLFFRLNLWKKPLPALSFLISLVVTALVYRHVVGAGRSNGIAPFAFLRVLPPSWWVFFPLVHLFWSWVYVLLRLRSEGVRNLADLRSALSRRTIVDVEVVAVFAIVGQLPGNVFEIPNANAYYFTDFQRWVSLSLLIGSTTVLATLSEWGKTLRHKSERLTPLSRMFAWVLVAPFLLTIILTAATWGGRLISDNLATRREIQGLANTRPETGVASGVKQMVKSGLRGHPLQAFQDFQSSQLGPLADRVMIDRVLRSSPRYPVVTALRRAAHFPGSTRSQSILFVDPDVAQFWGILPKAECIYSPMVGPAMAGLPMLDAIPPGCRFESYILGRQVSPPSQWPMPHGAPDAIACDRVRRKGFRYMVRIAPAPNNQVSLRSVDCSVK